MPTISTITPNRGATSGQALIEIVGSDFRVPTPVPNPSGVTLPPPPTVRVEFGATAASVVRVVSSTRLLVVLPDGDAGAVDVRVTNLDDFGAPIGTVTLPGGFTFERPDFTRDSRPTMVVRELIRSLKRWIVPNVVYTQHVDYDDDPIEALRKVAEVSLPMVALTGPTLRANPVQAESEDPTAPLDAGAILEYRQPKVYDLVFGMTVAMDSAFVTLGMVNAVVSTLNRRTLLAVDHGGATGVVNYEIAIEGSPEVQSRATRSSVYSASFALTVFAVHIVDLPGFANDMATAIRPLVTEPPTIGSVSFDVEGFST